jgi:hypothetical protein
MQRWSMSALDRSAHSNETVCQVREAPILPKKSFRGSYTRP